MIKEFKEFVMKGNVLDMAVGIIIGAAFGKVVTSFVSDVLMPPIGLLLGKVDFSNLFINMSGKTFESLAEAKKAGAATLNYGLFLNTTIDFLIVGFAVFLMVKQVKPRVGARSRPCPQHARVPLLLDHYRSQGHPLPALHVRTSFPVSLPVPV